MSLVSLDWHHKDCLASCSIRSLNAFFAKKPKPWDLGKHPYEAIATGSGCAVYIETLSERMGGKTEMGKWMKEVDKCGIPSL